MANWIKNNRIDIIGLQEVGIYSDGNREDIAKNIADQLEQLILVFG